jgi:hypothetical protein
MGWASHVIFPIIPGPAQRITGFKLQNAIMMGSENFFLARLFGIVLVFQDVAAAAPHPSLGTRTVKFRTTPSIRT